MNFKSAFTTKNKIDTYITDNPNCFYKDANVFLANDETEINFFDEPSVNFTLDNILNSNKFLVLVPYKDYFAGDIAITKEVRDNIYDDIIGILDSNSLVNINELTVNRTYIKLI